MQTECGWRSLCALSEYKREPVTPSPLSIDTPADKKNLPVKNRFENALNQERTEVAEGKRVEEVLSEPEEDMDIGATPAKEIVPGNYSPGTTWEMIQDLSGEERANTATPPLGSPRKKLRFTTWK